MRNLFDEGDIRASSDRYLRNAIIAVLAYDRARDAVGRRATAVGHRGGLRLPHARRPARARPAGVQGDRRLLHRGAARPAARRQEHDDLQARRAGQQGGAAAQLAVDQARAAEHLADGRLRPRHRRRRGAGRQGRARRGGGRQHVGAHAAAHRDARRRAGTPAGRRARRAAGGRGAEDRRGAAGHQPRLRADDGAQAIGRAGDGRLLAGRRAVDRSRGAPPARRAVRPSRLLRHRLGRRTPGRPPSS